MPRAAMMCLIVGLMLGLGCDRPSDSSTALAETPAKADAPKADAPQADAPQADAPPAAQPADGFDQAMAAVVTPYLRIHDALARDSVEGVADAAQALTKAAEALDPQAPDATRAGHLAAIKAALTTGGAATAAAAGDLARARVEFKAVSQGMGRWATLSAPGDLDLVYCPMVKASWLQKPGPIRNPYHGSEMLACGEVVSGPSKAKAN